MDFYVVNNDVRGGPSPTDQSRLFINQGLPGSENNHWSELRLHGWLSNREGIGARLEAEVGGEVLKRQVLADPVYVSSGTRMIHFGLGRSQEIGRLTIDWPSGIHQEVVALPGDHVFQVQEPRVTMEAADDPVWRDGEMRFSVQLENHRNRDVVARVYWFLHVGANGSGFAILQQLFPLGPNEATSVGVSIPLSSAEYRALGRLNLDQRAYVVCEDGVDSRQRADIFGGGSLAFRAVKQAGARR